MNVEAMDTSYFTGTRQYQAQAPGEISPEVAVSVFGILSGIGGAASQLIAGNQLQGVDEPIHMSQMAPALGLSIAGAVAGAFLLPP